MRIGILLLCFCIAQSQLYGFGKNDRGELGLGHRKVAYQPQHVNSLAANNIWKIACGQSHTLILLYDGSIYVFGHNGVSYDIRQF
jgi:RCC1 and BTB domain-containing protein